MSGQPMTVLDLIQDLMRHKADAEVVTYGDKAGVPLKLECERCDVCGKVIVGPRTMNLTKDFCSQACVDEYLSREGFNRA